MEEIKDLKEIQKLSFNILCYVDKICRENNIKYSLAYGTVIGAVRHKGFIPWDDDIDIIMPRDDYERFLQIMDNTPHDRYKALHYGNNCPNYYYRFTKVVDLTTHLEESTLKTNNNLGVFIDVFPADGIDTSQAPKILKKHLTISRFLVHSMMEKLDTKNVSKAKLFGKILIYPIAKLFGSNYWIKKYNKMIEKYPFNEYDNCLTYSGCYGEKDIFPKKYFDNLIEITFEKKKFLVFKEYDEYLTNMYGDYMTPPPKEKQVTHHNYRVYKKDTK